MWGDGEGGWGMWGWIGHGEFKVKVVLVNT